MASRKKIVFPYYNSYYTSTAIIIYQSNIIRTLNLLPDHLKPHLSIWHTHQSPLHEIKKIGYPYISFINIKSPSFRLKKLASAIINRAGLSGKILFNTSYDCIYPAYQDNFLNGIKRRVYWKADFQENYFPQYFTKDELHWVKDFFMHLKQDGANPLVLSSYDAWNDLKQFYPDVKNEVLLFRFVSHMPEINSDRLMDVLKKFPVTKPYFIACNQYWPHKNHMIILKALSILKKHGELSFQTVFTGKTNSIRGNDYFIELKSYMEDNDLVKDIIITDFIEREEQLLLMKNAVAVVQPTTFEGWSTVIEDAKALNRYVIASDIAVNMEQIKQNVTFFNPQDAEALAVILANISAGKPVCHPVNYQTGIDNSINDLKVIFELGE